MPLVTRLPLNPCDRFRLPVHNLQGEANEQTALVRAGGALKALRKLPPQSPTDVITEHLEKANVRLAEVTARYLNNEEEHYIGAYENCSGAEGLAYKYRCRIGKVTALRTLVSITQRFSAVPAPTVRDALAAQYSALVRYLKTDSAEHASRTLPEQTHLQRLANAGFNSLVKDGSRPGLSELERGYDLVNAERSLTEFRTIGLNALPALPQSNLQAARPLLEPTSSEAAQVQSDFQSLERSFQDVLGAFREPSGDSAAASGVPFNEFTHLYDDRRQSHSFGNNDLPPASNDEELSAMRAQNRAAFELSDGDTRQRDMSVTRSSYFDADLSDTD